VVRRIVKKAAQSDYRLSSIVMGIVESAPFQMRTKLEAEPQSAASVARPDSAPPDSAPPVRAGVTHPLDSARIARSNK
jgi:hypothetical protein